MFKLLLIIFNCTLLTKLNAEIIGIDGFDKKEGFSDYEINFLGEIEGALLEAHPADGCSNITNAPQHVNDSFNWIVLMSEGVCRVQDKVRHAEAANFAAVILYNSEPDPFLYDSRYAYLSLRFLNLTTVAIGHIAGIRIKEKYLYTIDPQSRIIIMPSNVFNIITFLLLFAVIAGTFFFMMFLFMIIKCVRQSRERRHNRLSSVHLNQLKTTKYKQGDPYEMCAICLEDYKDKDKLRILPCSHGYHCRCIDPWLTNNKRNCPICKKKVVLSGVHSDSDSDTDSRAERSPLVHANAPRYHHGTFNSGFDNNYDHHLTQADNRNSGDEATLRDVPSDFLDDISEEEVNPIRPSSSAPNLSFVAFARNFSNQKPGASNIDV